jgi:hypothetical protein
MNMRTAVLSHARERMLEEVTITVDPVTNVVAIGYARLLIMHVHGLHHT